VRLEVRQPAPCAAIQTKYPLEHRDVALNPGAEAFEFLVYSDAAGHLFNLHATLLRQAHRRCCFKMPQRKIDSMLMPLQPVGLRTLHIGRYPIQRIQMRVQPIGHRFVF